MLLIMDISVFKWMVNPLVVSHVWSQPNKHKYLKICVIDALKDKRWCSGLQREDNRMLNLCKIAGGWRHYHCPRHTAKSTTGQPLLALQHASKWLSYWLTTGSLTVSTRRMMLVPPRRFSRILISRLIFFFLTGYKRNRETQYLNTTSPLQHHILPIKHKIEVNRK